jgi:hypothetical protein
MFQRAQDGPRSECRQSKDDGKTVTMMLAPPPAITA